MIRRVLSTVASAVCLSVFVFMCALTISALLTGCSTVGEEKVPHQIRIEEDSPWWDCHTMGNQQCGPVEGVVAA